MKIIVSSLYVFPYCVLVLIIYVNVAHKGEKVLYSV